MIFAWLRGLLCDVEIHGRYMTELSATGARRYKCLYCNWNDVTGGTPE